jgi:hypothetical protein
MPRDYRVPAHVLAANMPDESVLLQLEAKQYYQLNETGQHIWQLIERGEGGAAIVASLVASYQVTAVEAAAEYERLAAELVERGLLEPAGTPADPKD